MSFRDHHLFTDRDVERITAAAHAAGAAIVLTTEKDAVRLAGCRPGPMPIAAVPLIVSIEPPDAFADWLFDRLRAPRRAPQRTPGADPRAAGT
jgi:tetraacyldisaccharide-1-P 4'-kinase